MFFFVCVFLPVVPVVCCLCSLLSGVSFLLSLQSLVRLRTVVSVVVGCLYYPLSSSVCYARTFRESRAEQKSVLLEMTQCMSSDNDGGDGDDDDNGGVTTTSTFGGGGLLIGKGWICVSSPQRQHVKG